jgi:hypothetical protein
MNEVFLLWHVHEFADGHEDVKLIGVYRTQIDAEAALERARKQPGFAELPDEFEIHAHQLNRDGWTEGYFTYPGSSSAEPEA